MSVDLGEIKAMRKKLNQLQKDIPDIMDRMAVEEGRYTRDQAREICKRERIVNTGNYRRNFQYGEKALRIGRFYKVDVYNHTDYARHLEYGFRSHFVPGHWEGHTFVYQPNDSEGGMYVGKPGGYVPGHHTLRRAVQRTRETRKARLARKMNRIFNEYMK